MALITASELAHRAEHGVAVAYVERRRQQARAGVRREKLRQMFDVNVGQDALREPRRSAADRTRTPILAVPPPKRASAFRDVSLCNWLRRESYQGPIPRVTAARTILALRLHMSTSTHDTDWRRHLVDDDEGIDRVLRDTHRIAVLGIKIDPEQPAHFVPAYAQHAGCEIVPVPVYYPDVTEILGERVYRTVAAVPGDDRHGQRLSAQPRCGAARRRHHREAAQSACGCSSEFATTRRPSDSPARGSTSCRTAA